MLANSNAIKCFLGKLGEMYSLEKKPETQHDSAPSLEEFVNEVVQAVITKENDPSTLDSSYRVAVEDNLWTCFTSLPGGCYQCWTD